jgi:ParB/RepB/Spo0J family partition protein
VPEQSNDAERARERAHELMRRLRQIRQPLTRLRDVEEEMRVATERAAAATARWANVVRARDENGNLFTIGVDPATAESYGMMVFSEYNEQTGETRVLDVRRISVEGDVPRRTLPAEVAQAIDDAIPLTPSAAEDRARQLAAELAAEIREHEAEAEMVHPDSAEAYPSAAVMGAQLELISDDDRQRYRPTASFVPVEQVFLPEPFLEPTTEFVQNVQAFGVLQSIAVRRLPMNDPRRPGGFVYEVIAGRRRLRAAMRNEMDRVPALIFPVGTPTRLVAAMALAENTHRAPNPITDLEAIEQMAREGYSEEQMAHSLRISLNTLRARMRLATLIPALREAVVGGRIALGTASQIARLDRERQRRLLDLLTERGEGGRVLATDVRDVLMARQAEAVETLPDSLFPERTENGEVQAWARERDQDVARAVAASGAPIQVSSGQRAAAEFGILLVEHRASNGDRQHASVTARFEETEGTARLRVMVGEVEWFPQSLLAEQLAQVEARLGNEHGRRLEMERRVFELEQAAASVQAAAPNVTGPAIRRQTAGELPTSESWGSVRMLLEHAERLMPAAPDADTDSMAGSMMEFLERVRVLEGRQGAGTVIAPEPVVLAAEEAPVSARTARQALADQNRVTAEGLTARPRPRRTR